jgi:hypothetical protein
VPYTADKPSRARPSAELRDRIPGWGADLDLADRPSVPRERWDPGATGAHWELPEQQPELVPRERSIEHALLTPVFGTTSPPRLLSGVLRRYAFTYSEARAAHWLLLLGADRVDVVESRVLDLMQGRATLLPTGLSTEATHGGWRSRAGAGRVDVLHQWMDPVVATAGTAGVAAAAVALRRRKGRGR